MTRHPDNPTDDRSKTPYKCGVCCKHGLNRITSGRGFVGGNDRWGGVVRQGIVHISSEYRWDLESTGLPSFADRLGPSL